ncbi:MAG: folylpolyglutamate synthase/dihydrofolate synthase family protein [Pseudomonadota bacterium]
MTSASRLDELINSLSGLHPKAIDLSLDRMLRILERVGNPHLKLPPVVHVAGTNGKGSTIAFLRSIFEAAGLSVHVDTSPHLVRWNERYRLGAKGGGQLVDDDTLEDAIRRAAKANRGEPITLFEILSVAGFLLFSEHPADVLLLEVGLGGRFDCTNVIANPGVCVITPVSMDHQGFLGDTIEQIAFEKAGIIKPACPVVCGVQRDAARQVIEDRADELSAPIIFQGQDFGGHVENGGMAYQDLDSFMDLPQPALRGTHQINNAALAIAAAKQSGLIAKEMFAGAVDTGLSKAEWPGRLQRLEPRSLGVVDADRAKRMEIWLDGGHNPDAGMVASAFMVEREERSPRPLILICGMLNTKDPEGFFKYFSGLAKQVHTVPIVSSDAGINPSVLAEHATKAGLVANSHESFRNAWAQASENPDCRILICGSLYLVGDVLGSMRQGPQ